MSLQRKENTLRKAQARYDRVSRQAKQFQVAFRREAVGAAFRTRAFLVRDERERQNRCHGLLHHAAGLKCRISGDAPSVTRFLNSFEPTSQSGKALKTAAQAANFLAHDTVQTVTDAGLASETIALKSSETAQREVVSKLKQKYTHEAVDDYHRGVFFMGRTAVDADKGIRRHLTSAKQHRVETAKYRFQKAEYAVLKAKLQKPERSADKSKREFRLECRKLRTDTGFRVKELRNQRKIAKNSDAGLLAVKPAQYTAERMRASAWQQAISEEEDNDFLHAVDTAKRRIADPAVQKTSKPQKLQREEKRRDKLSAQKSRSQKKLRRAQSKLVVQAETAKKVHKKQKQRKRRKKVKEALIKLLEKLITLLTEIPVEEIKKAAIIAGIVIVAVLLLLALILVLFLSVVSHGGFTLGTYAAQDYDLSEAEKYYTELAYNFNENILKTGDETDWKKGLKALGADTSGLKDNPVEWFWGNSSEFPYDPVYDFDCYKLWSFLCAYYYDFDSENGDIRYWKFTNNTKEVLEELFDAEYEFAYRYDNTSHWEYRNSFVSKGYYAVEGADVSGEYGTFTVSYPDALPFAGCTDGKTLYYDPGNGQVLNANDGFSPTGWYLKNQYITETDPAGSSYPAWYSDSTAASVPYYISEQNLCSFLQKYDWVTDCRLYYNVRQEKTFDEVISDTLGGMSHSEERLVYYNLLVGTDGSGAMYGNHQTLHFFLPDASVRAYEISREYGYEISGWNEISEGLFEGIKVRCASGEAVSAPFDCTIKEIDADKHTVTLRADDVMYWYDGTGGTKRDTEVTLRNAVLLDGFSEGNTLSDGQVFAETTGRLWVYIYIDTDGYGCDYIDPRLVLY